MCQASSSYEVKDWMAPFWTEVLHSLTFSVFQDSSSYCLQGRCKKTVQQHLADLIMLVVSDDLLVLNVYLYYQEFINIKISVKVK